MRCRRHPRWRADLFNALSNRVATQRVFPYPEGDEREWRNGMAIHLTSEQEPRVHAVMDRGAYESAEEDVDAALAAVDQGTIPGFAGTQAMLNLPDVAVRLCLH
jgi:hypothetical protein